VHSGHLSYLRQGRKQKMSPKRRQERQRTSWWCLGNLSKNAYDAKAQHVGKLTFFVRAGTKIYWWRRKKGRGKDFRFAFLVEPSGSRRWCEVVHGRAQTMRIGLIRSTNLIGPNELQSRVVFLSFCDCTSPTVRSRLASDYEWYGHGPTVASYSGL
jgi:hypothetical protein